MTAEPGPGAGQPPSAISSPGAICPACDRFIGPVDVCPYCGADSARSPILRRLRVAAILLVVVGLGYLYAAARWQRPVIVPIGAISPTMNFAVVRVAGVVARSPYVATEDGQTNYVSFVVADGTGEIQVRAYRDVAAELARTGRIPSRGTPVEAEGSLKVTGGRERNVRLHLAVATNLKLPSPGQAEAGSMPGEREP